MDRPELSVETERLIVQLARPGVEGRLLAYYSRNTAHLERWEPRRSAEFHTLTWWRRQLEINEREYEEDHGARTIIVERRDPSGPVVGIANLSNIVRGAFQACHLGYSIDAEYEGKSYMREALQGLIDFAFDTLDLHRIMANYQPENERSGALLKRLGFVEEGYARAYLNIDGAWRDHVLTALVRPDDD